MCFGRLIGWWEGAMAPPRGLGWHGLLCSIGCASWGSSTEWRQRLALHSIQPDKSAAARTLLRLRQMSSSLAAESVVSSRRPGEPSPSQALTPYEGSCPPPVPDSAKRTPECQGCAMSRPLIVLGFLITALFITPAGCSSTTNGASAPAPPEVETLEVQQRDVPIYSEWIGTLDGLVNADIKAEVSGYLLEQTYKEGSFVKKGQLLFQIDPRPFQAALDQALGQLAQAQGQVEQAQAQLTQAVAQVAVAEANQRRTQLDVDRYTPLAQAQAITQQDLEHATQDNSAAKAQVQSAKAQVATAKAQIMVANATLQA